MSKSSRPISSTQRESVSVHDLKPITALGGSDPVVETIASVTLSEVTNLALASVAARHGQEKGCEKALKKLLGNTAPGPGMALLAQPFSAVWMGPEQWMIGADFATHEDIAEIVKAAMGDTASVTEQTDAWAGFDLSGAKIDAVMELLCPINMRDFPAGSATRTSIHHLGCFVISGGAEFVRILGPRASAGSLHHAIHTAMRSAL